MSGTMANKGFIAPVYNSSKAAVIQLARSLAMEWGEIKADGSGGIRVNSLSPGRFCLHLVAFQADSSCRAHCDADGGGQLPKGRGGQSRVGKQQHAGAAQHSGGIQGGRGVLAEWSQQLHDGLEHDHGRRDDGMVRVGVGGGMDPWNLGTLSIT